MQKAYIISVYNFTGCVIIVSPEKTPPPPSPSLPRSPILDRAMWYIEQAINESTEPGVTTFTSVLSRTPGTRTYVAKMFSFLLSKFSLLWY